MRPSAVARLVLLLLALSGLAAASRAEDTPPAPEPVTVIALDEAVRAAVARNIALAGERINRATAREAVAIARAAYDPTLDLAGRRTGSSSYNRTITDDATSVVAGVTQRIDTGATVSLNSNLSRSSSNDPLPGAAYNPQYDSDASVTVSQPLLNGAGFAANRAARRRARIGVERSDVSYLARVLDTVRDTEIAFFDIAFAQRQLEVQRSGLEAAQRFLQENEARREAGLATELDVMQARVGVANRRTAIIAAEQRARDAADVLLALLGHTKFAGRVELAGLAFEPAPTTTVERSFGSALDNDADLQAERALLRQLELDVTLANNQRLPRLDLGGTLGYSGTDSTLGGSTDSLWGRDDYVWEVDLTVSVPWALREGRARARTARLTADQQRVRLEQLEQDLLVRVRAAVRAVQADSDAVDSAAESALFSGREYELEKARFESGLSTSRLVVDAQQRRDEAQVLEMQARVTLSQDIARLRRIEGVSLQRYSLDPLAQK